MSKIGIFDSGIGGLTVLKRLILTLPNEDYIYIGDNKNCPYGDKTKEQLWEYATKIIDYFIKREVNLIIVGCNTVNSNIFNELIIKYSNIKIIGVIESTIEKVIALNPNSCLIIATKQTIKAKKYQQKINEQNKGIQTINLATPLLVPMIEENNPNIEIILRNYLEEYTDQVDILVLGCTHYEIVEDKINKIFNKPIVSSSAEIVVKVKCYLESNNLTNQTKGKTEIFTTGNVGKFIEASSFFDYNNKKVSSLDL